MNSAHMRIWWGFCRLPARRTFLKVLGDKGQKCACAHPAVGSWQFLALSYAEAIGCQDKFFPEGGSSGKSQ
jgi:hypothetical protein